MKLASASAPTFQAFQQAAQGESDDLRALQASERGQLLQDRNVRVTQSKRRNFHARTVTHSRRKPTDSAVSRHTNILAAIPDTLMRRAVPCFLSALRFCLSLLLLPPVYAQGQNLLQWKVPQVYVLASLNALSLASPKQLLHDPKTSVDALPDGSRKTEPAVDLLKTPNSLNVAIIEPDSGNPRKNTHVSTLLHESENCLKGSGSRIIAREQLTATTNDIHRKPESIQTKPNQRQSRKSRIGSKHSQTTVGSTPPSLEHKALPLENLLNPKKPTLNRSKDLIRDTRANMRERILSRMAWQESREEDPQYRPDRRIAEILVALTMRGEPQADIKAWLAVLHCHPNRVWPNIVENRKLKLGREYYEFYDSNDMPRPDVKANLNQIHDDFPTSAHPIEPAGAGASESLAPKSPAPVSQIQRKDKRA